ncbi:MAG: hypothetical protein IKS28_07245 [Clostridia bacterium]|nr:hypothetical protein [Clostridia bacterium]
MKKTLAVCLLASAMLLVACGGPSPDLTESSQPETEFVTPVLPETGSATQRRPDVNDNGAGQYGPKEGKSEMEPTKNNTVSLKSCGAAGNGTKDDGPALKKALQKLSGKGFVVIEKGTYRLASDIEVPGSVTLIFTAGAKLSPDSGRVLSVKGYVDAGIGRIFEGEGNITGPIKSAGYPHWFGETGNGDCSAAFQAAVDACSVVKIPYRNTAYRVSGLIISHPVRIEGVGSKQVQLKISTGNPVCVFDIRSSDVYIGNLKIQGDAGKSSVFLFNDSERDLANITLSSVWAFELGYFIRDVETGGRHVINNVNLLDLRGDRCRMTGIRLTDFRYGIRLNCVQIQNLGAQYDVKYPGMSFDGVLDMYMTEIDVTGRGPSSTGAGGLVFKNCSNVTLERADMEQICGHAMYLENCSAFYMNHWVSGMWDVESVKMTGCRDCVFDLWLIIGENHSLDRSGAKKFGAGALRIENCEHLTFNALHVQRVYGDGVVMSDCSGNVFNSLTLTQVNGRGAAEEGDCKSNFFNALSMSSVKGTNLILVSEGSCANGAVLSDGKKYDRIGGQFEKQTQKESEQ